MKAIKGLLKSVQILLVLTLLLSFSAHADQQLFQAVRGGNLTKVKTFVSGAGGLPSINVNMNINARDSQGKTALHWAVSDAHMSSDVAKLLIQVGADPNIKDDRGWTPVHWALNYNRHDLVLLLGKSGADMDVTYEDGHTPLHHAWSNLELTRLLLQAGADVNVTDTHGWTALHHAAFNGKHAVVYELISAGADVNVKDNQGWTLFHLAFLYAHYLTADVFVKAGANVDARGPNGNTLLHLAILYGDEDFFSDSYHNWRGHIRASSPEEIQMFLVGELIRLGADVNVLDARGYSPLSLALVPLPANKFNLKPPKLDIAQLLIENGADPNMVDSTGVTPVYNASYYKFESILDSLLNAGGDPNVSDPYAQSTPLHRSSSNGDLTTTASLLQFGADPFARNRFKRTPLKEAKLMRKTERTYSKRGIREYPEINREYSEVIKLLRKDMGIKRFNPFMKNKK